jgi:hypothetical protein
MKRKKIEEIMKKSMFIKPFIMAGYMFAVLLLLIPKLYAVDANPTWYVDARCFTNSSSDLWNEISVKDPSIIYSEGRYHLFFTRHASSGTYSIGYPSATTIDGLNNTSRTKLDLLGSGTTRYRAPEVFLFEPHNKWYLIYQVDELGGCYATTTNLGDPNSWAGPQTFGITAGWVFS